MASSTMIGLKLFFNVRKVSPFYLLMASSTMIGLKLGGGVGIAQTTRSFNGLFHNDRIETSENLVVGEPFGSFNGLFHNDRIETSV